MAQHLLAAADRFQLIRLRCICEQRLCETVEVGLGTGTQTGLGLGGEGHGSATCLGGNSLC